MTTQETVQIGDPVLRETAQNAENIDSVASIITDLTDTMQSEKLVGIAAPQIGVSARLFVSEIREGNMRNAPVEPLCVYINPEIVHVSHETELDYEGCGSIAHGDIFGLVERSIEITVKYKDGVGVSREKTASGLLARIIQHEMDHLDGILFTDLCDPKTLVSREYYIKHVLGTK